MHEIVSDLEFVAGLLRAGQEMTELGPELRKSVAAGIDIGTRAIKSKEGLAQLSPAQLEKIASRFSHADLARWGSGPRSHPGSNTPR